MRPGQPGAHECGRRWRASRDRTAVRAPGLHVLFAQRRTGSKRAPSPRSGEGGGRGRAEGEQLHLIPRKQVGIPSERLRRRAKRRHKRSCSKANARAHAANARWERYARVQAVLVGSLRKIGKPLFDRLADEVSQCHRWFQGHRCTEGHAWATPGFSCRLRLCPFEMRARSMAALHKFGDVLARLKEPRYLVLTVENCALEELRRGIDDLFAAFERLRHSHLWTSVRGALAVLEVTFNESAVTWHPHLNIIFEGEYISKSELDAVWFRATRGRGRITWIQRADRRTVLELLKYVTKLLDFVHKPEAVEWFLKGTYRKRFIRTYGSLYGLKLEEDTREGRGDDPRLTCPDCGCRDLETLPAPLRLDDVYFDTSGVLRFCERVCNDVETRHGRSPT